MSNNSDDNPNEKRNLGNIFALAIKETENKQYEIRSENNGIQDSQIVFLVETWLEHVKKRMKENVKF